MTTGAVCFFFENKEDLFCSLVRETAEQMEQMMEEMTEWELGTAGDGSGQRCSPDGVSVFPQGGSPPSP